MTQCTEVATEEWRPVVGFEKTYAVSNLGRLKRVGGGRAAQVGRILSLRPHRGGYHRVTLHDGTRKVAKLVHKLVTEAFIGLCPPKHCCNHKYGVKSNNVVSNLEYVTWPENTRHAKSMGLIPSGGSSASAKLTDRQAQEVRLLGKWVLHSKLAKLYGVSQHTIWSILHNRSYTAILKEADERNVTPELLIEIITKQLKSI